MKQYVPESMLKERIERKKRMGREEIDSGAARFGDPV